MKKNFKKLRKNKGQAMLISAIFFLFLSLAIIAGLVSPSVREFKVSNDLIKSRQSFFLSESAVEDSYFRLKTAKALGSTNTVTLGADSAIATITDSGYNEKTISSVGDVSLRQRTNEIVLNTGDGASFAYGIQSGLGGFKMGNSTIYGNVYSNGTITSDNPNATIKGSAFSAGGLIDKLNVGTAGEGGDAWADNVVNSTVVGNLYCKTGSGNNKNCDTSKENPDNPPVISMPITETMIDKWKADASEDIHEGNLTISTATSLGPKKITGNLTINANLTILNTIYVVGTISIANQVEVSLSPSYGATLGILMTDSPIDLSNGVIFSGSGETGSYIMLLTTSACPTTGCPTTNALEIGNNANAVILNAQNGTANIQNQLDLNELVANKIIIGNQATITYLSGLANTSFTSGPLGGWNITSWKEVK